jgi:hypothetical protein
MIHIISATSTYTDETRTTTTQFAMCGAGLGNYMDAVHAGHPTGNYMAPTLEGALSKGVTCPACLKPFAPTSTPRHNGPTSGSTPFLTPTTDEETVTPEGNRVILERSGDYVYVVHGARYVTSVRHAIGSRVWEVSASVLHDSPVRFRTGREAWAYVWSYVDALV